MAIEHASVQVVRKPWGVTDLRPWSDIDVSGGAVGELWFHRQDQTAPVSALLLKLLFTSELLSIQVHPDDAFARSIGLPNGKTEAWYILSALPDARVAVGLKRRLSPDELLASIRNGSVADLVQWRPVIEGDVVFVPAGTIHAIGAGIVLAEIQQHSDATFRLFDYGRRRELHIENAVAVATIGPLKPQSLPERLTGARTALTVSPHFALERIDLLPGSVWMLDAPKEAWLLVIEGHAQLGGTRLSLGDAVFLQADHADIAAGADGLKALLAYPGPTINPDALTERSAIDRIPHASLGAP